MRPVPATAVSFIKAKEACRLTGYLDSADIPTWGYGHTGPEVVVGKQITQRQADLSLKADLAVAARRLANAVKPEVIAELTEHQYAALISFVFNLGCDAKWRIWKRLNARQFDQVPAEMIRFVNAGGRKVQGLVNRRTAEIALWSTDEPGSVSDEMSSGATRAVETPPAPSEPPKPAHLIAAGVMAAGGVAEGAKKVSEIVEPFADKSALVQHIVEIAATAGAGAALALAGLLWFQHWRAKR